MPTAASDDERAFEYLLRLGDSPLVLAQRLGEWVGKGPALEEDIALTNVGLDLIGQARLWLSYAGEVEARYRGRGRSEDELAFRRDGGDFRNLLLVEQPNGNYADTIARQFLFDAWHLLALDALRQSRDTRVAEIAAKGAKEVAYHVERSADWVIRLGDGTELSHARMQAAIDALWTYTGEMFGMDATELALVEAGIAADARSLEAPWRRHVEAVLAEATLTVPPQGYMQGGGGRGGKQGVHTEHLGRLLAEMQFLQRAYPDAQW
jgi:ring-1,2-phenylacetyl-CoA epoxidase subunit PaaC